MGGRQGRKQGKPWHSAQPAAVAVHLVIAAVPAAHHNPCEVASTVQQLDAVAAKLHAVPAELPGDTTGLDFSPPLAISRRSKLSGEVGLINLAGAGCGVRHWRQQQAPGQEVRGHHHRHHAEPCAGQAGGGPGSRAGLGRPVQLPGMSRGIKSVRSLDLDTSIRDTLRLTSHKSRLRGALAFPSNSCRGRTAHEPAALGPAQSFQ